MNPILDALKMDSSPESDHALATVATVSPDGVTLILDGQETASEKKYKGNTSVSLAPGDRVKLTRISGTWLIDYKVGVPGSGGSGSSPTSINSLTNETRSISLSSNGFLTPHSNNGVTLGSSTLRFAGIYVNGQIYLGNERNSKLSFFGAQGSTKVSLPASPTITDIVNLLSAYGLA